MFTDDEITAGAARLVTGTKKLRPRDRHTLLALFRIYLKDRAAGFADLPARLENVTDDGNSDQTAAQLSALVLAFEDAGFSLSELAGGKSGLRTDTRGELVLKIQYGLTLLDYDLPEFFSGGLECGSAGAGFGALFSGTFSMKKDLTGGW